MPSPPLPAPLSNNRPLGLWRLRGTLFPHQLPAVTGKAITTSWKLRTHLMIEESYFQVADRSREGYI